jgi:hypothetical protein
MISKRQIRRLFEARTREAMAHGTDMAGYRRGGLAFLREWHETLGVRFGDDCRPGFHTHPDTGVGYKPAGSAHANEVSLRHLAEAIQGHDFVEEYYHPAGGFDFGSRQLLEAAIDPAAFVNVNLFNLSVAGLVNAEIIERYDTPEYIGRNLVTIKPTNMNGQKLIGVAQIGPVSSAAKGRQPGETHAEIGFTDKYQTTPETVEQALKVVVTKEATFFDYTGQVLEQAGMVGDELAYGQEKSIADEVLGATNSYNFGGTSYNTYQGTSPWVNDLTQTFADETSIDAARQLFVNMTDPITGREIRVNGRDVLCMPARELKFRQALFGTNVQVGTQLNSNFPSRYTFSPAGIGQVGANMGGGMYTLTPLTPIWYNRATATDGLARSAADAKELFYVGDYKKAVWWMENWPLTPWQASADELTMKDRGLVAVFGANYRGKVYTREPRYIVRNKPS